MTDHDRAERAFRRAFEAHADDVEFTPLDPDSLITRPESARARRRRPWVPFAVAAAVLPLVAVPVVSVVASMFNAQSATPAAAPAAAPAGPGFDTTAAGGAPEAASSAPQQGDSVRPSADDWRWESMLDAAVQVPSDWEYAFAPDESWCREPAYRRPDRPFVQRNPLETHPRPMPCTEPAPDSLRQTHLTFRPAEPGDADGVVPVGAAEDWFRVSRVVGSAFLTVTVPAVDLELAERILAMARTNAVDPRGCSVTTPTGRPTAGALADLTTASEVTLCQYAGLPGDGPNLVGSRSLTGIDAHLVLDAVRATPTTDNTPPQACTPTRAELVLIVDGGVAQATLPLDGCRPAHWDDGHQLHQVSRASCADLMFGPLWQVVHGEEEIAAACAPER